MEPSKQYKAWMALIKNPFNGLKEPANYISEILCDYGKYCEWHGANLFNKINKSRNPYRAHHQLAFWLLCETFKNHVREVFDAYDNMRRAERQLACHETMYEASVIGHDEYAELRKPTEEAYANFEALRTKFLT